LGRGVATERGGEAQATKGKGAVDEVSTSGAERQRWAQHEENTVVRTPSLAGRRETTQMWTSSGRVLMWSAPSQLSQFSAIARRRGCGALLLCSSPESWNPAHGGVPLAHHNSQGIVGRLWRRLHGPEGRSQEDQDGGDESEIEKRKVTVSSPLRSVSVQTGGLGW
jgi:hypothetical protein